MNQTKAKSALLIAGPTASGKSALALKLAQEREALIAKAKKLAELAGGGGEGTEAARAAFFQSALERMHNDTDCGECRARKEGL